MRPLLCCAVEDENTLTTLRKHLCTLDVPPDKTVLRPGLVKAELQRVEQEQPFIVLLSVDSLLLMKDHLAMLKEIARQRRQRFGRSGILFIPVRACAWQEYPFLKSKGLTRWPHSTIWTPNYH